MSFDIAVAINRELGEIKAQFVHNGRAFLATGHLHDSREPKWYAGDVANLWPLTADESKQLYDQAGPLWDAAQDAVDALGAMLAAAPGSWLKGDDLDEWREQGRIDAAIERRIDIATGN
jgi:hypothetical protein